MKRISLIFLTLFLISSAVVIRGHNRATAEAQARSIVAADSAGEPTEPLLKTLKSFVKGHTGSSVTLNLGGSYARAQDVAKAAATAQSGTGQLYAEGQQKCASKSDSIVQARCVQDYVSSHLKTNAPPTPVVPPNPNDFIVRLTAPSYAADTATLLWGISVITLMAAVFPLTRKKRLY